MLPGTYNFTHKCGTTFTRKTLSLFTTPPNPGDEDIPQPWNAISAKMQIRKCKSGPIILQWSTDESSIEISEYEIFLNEKTPQEMNITPGVYEYDLYITNTQNQTFAYIQGTFTFLEQISK